MLSEDVIYARENEEKTISKQAACKFCGQMAAVEVLPDQTEDEWNEIATELCHCETAKKYVLVKGQTERSHEKINELFGEKSSYELEEDRMNYLHAAVEPIVKGQIKTATIEITGESKMKIQRTKKEKIKIECISNLKNTCEA